MAEIKKGSVVKSIAGHDANRFYVVLEVSERFALIADGKLRTLEKPKKKNRRHLGPTHVVIRIETLTTNKKIRKALWPYNYGEEAISTV